MRNWTSKNPLVRIEAYNKFYESPNILNEDYLVKKKLLDKSYIQKN